MTTGTLTFIDSAFPLPVYPPADGIGFYIGGDTPHVWSAEEINATPYRYRLPIFVRSNPQGADATVDGNAVLSTLRRLAAPKGSLVALDFEIAIDPAYVSAFCLTVTNGGYKVILYGSESFVHRNNMPDGLYWGADWTKVNHIAASDSATQWVSLAAYDMSTFKMTLPLWDLHPAVAPGRQPGTITVDFPWMEGDTGNKVRAIQALAGPKRGHDLACDGVFGPDTAAAVKNVQTVAKIGVDGIVGLETWAALLDT